MEVLDNIHTERTRIGKQQQTALSNELDKLNSVLQKLNLKHPYSWNPELFNELLNVSSHFKNSASNNFKLKIETDCLYRYTTFNRLIKSNGLRWHNKLIDPNVAFKLLCNRVENEDVYEFKLSDFMKGIYKNGRGFSWWTNHKIEDLEDVFRLGIPSDWIAPKSIIMKIRDKDIIHQQQKTPSIIEAFDSPIFNPAKVSENKGIAGKTLNLNDSSTFKGGCEEYITGAIDVDKISITPYEFDITKKEVFLESILNDLLKFYKTI